MGVEEDIKKRALRIKELLLGSSLKEALEQMQTQMAGVSDWSVISRYEDIDRSYKYMLQYFSQGSPDEHRTELYRQLVRRALLLNDEMLRVRMQPQSMLLYYQHLRSCQSRTETIESIRLVLESYIDTSDVSAHERALHLLFDLIWTNGQWSAEESSQMQQLVESPLVPDDDSAFAVSAVMLSLMQRFDPLKCLFLCQMAESLSTAVSIRSLAGLAVTLTGYTDILPYFPEIESRIKLLSDAPGIAERMLKVQMALLQCRETKEIDRRMREEIIPTMLRNPKLGDLMREELERDDVSPDWMDWIERSDVKDKLLQMSELQMEGADVYMSTFANLKNYPFFHEVCNWFRVFSTDQPDVRASFADDAILKSAIGRSMLSSGVFCNSDKYSFALTFSQIPREQREMITSQLSDQAMDEINEIKSGQVSADVTETLLSRQYVQDLYRFFNLFSRRHEFRDPFSDNLNLLIDTPLSYLLQTEDSEQKIAAWLLHKNYYDEAVQAYRLMERNNHPYSTDYRFYQQMGYALQRTQAYKDALEAYRRSDILQSNNNWTMRHSAQCLRILGEPQEALNLLLEAERNSADNLSLQIQIGDCLVDLKRYEEALTRFFKVDYLKPDYPKAWRAIGWCAFLAGRYDRSIEYYDKLLAGKPTANDCLNAGHAYLVSHNIQRAVSLYRQCGSIMGKEAFEAEFHKDHDILVAKGIQDQDFPLILDLI